MRIKNIVVVGSGTMGSSIAQVFAANHNLNVTIKTRELKESRFEAIENNLSIMLVHNAISEEEKNYILNHIHFETDNAKAYSNADFVIENVPEDMEIKQNLFVEIEKYCSDKCILATDSSVMSSTEIGSKCLHPERVVGAHFWNPGHLIPLVEVIKSDKTEEWVVEETMELLSECGKKPVYCKKDVPGFIANRLQHALWREAFYIVENGIADAKTVDDACKYGPGLRWPVMGPMENSDLAGIELTRNIHEYILPSLADNHKPSKLLYEMIEQGDLGFKSGKGWQEWTAKEIQQETDGLKEYLLDYTNKDRIK